MIVALPGGGCSYQIGSQKEEEKPLLTGSVGAVAALAPSQISDEDVKLPPEADLAFARIAAAEVLTKGGKDSSVPWENPRSGARGTITPLASAYQLEGSLCRDFLASYVAEGQESWMQGEACRVRKGKWEVRRLRPWRKT
jgi:surface antigen